MRFLTGPYSERERTATAWALFVFGIIFGLVFNTPLLASVLVSAITAGVVLVLMPRSE